MFMYDSFYPSDIVAELCYEDSSCLFRLFGGSTLIRSDKTMRTTVYIVDAQEELLLSEGVCRQLGILQYHPEVKPWKGKKPGQKKSSTATPTTDNGKSEVPKESTVAVPMVRVRLVRPLRLLPHQGAPTTVQVDSADLKLEAESFLLESGTGDSVLEVEDSLLRFDGEGKAQVTVFNPSGSSCSVEAGTELGELVRVTVCEPDPPGLEEATVGTESPVIRRVSETELGKRKQTLRELIGEPELRYFLGDHLLPGA